MRWTQLDVPAAAFFPGSIPPPRPELGNSHATDGVPDSDRHQGEQRICPIYQRHRLGP
jgi:hypothetical protein